MFASSLRDDASAKDSRYCAELTGDFVVNLATYEFREEINKTSAVLPRGRASPKRLVWTWYHHSWSSHRASDARPSIWNVFSSAALNYPPSARHREFRDFWQGYWSPHDEDLIVEGRVDICRARPIARLGYMDYAIVDDVFEMVAPSRAGKAFASIIAATAEQPAKSETTG